MDTSKIQLSAEEMHLVQNSEWILTKHRIIEKVYQLFGDLAVQMELHLAQQNTLVDEVLLVPAKISKGEQYKGLPYVVLDYPRYFSRENVLAVRSFFWWGHYFSITLQLKGKFYAQYHQKIANAIAAKKLKEYRFSVAGNEFSFDLEGNNYISGEYATHHLSKEMEPPSFFKISYKVSFEQWDGAGQKLMQAFEHLTGILLAAD